MLNFNNNTIITISDAPEAKFWLEAETSGKQDFDSSPLSSSMPTIEVSAEFK